MQKILILLLVCLLTSCKTNSKRTDLKIPREEFKQTLLDLHLLEGTFNPMTFSEDSLTNQQAKEYDSIFTVHNLDQDIFLEEYKRYVQYYPDDLDSIYNELIANVTNVRDSVANADGVTAPPMEPLIVDTLSPQPLLPPKPKLLPNEKKPK